MKRLATIRLVWLVSGVLLTCLESSLLAKAADDAASPRVIVVRSSEPTTYEECRRVIVGPGVNQPKAYTGYTGFVGWTGVAYTRTGALLVTFSSGYWHGSPPTGPTPVPLDFRQLFAQIAGVDISTFNAPRGGRAEISRSEDKGFTWSAPQVMIDTPDDDRSPAPLQLSDGSLIASLFCEDGRGSKKTGTIRSSDDGKSWEQSPRWLDDGPFTWTGTNGPPLEMQDKSILVCVYANNDPLDPEKPNSRLDKTTLWTPDGANKPQPDALQFGVFQSRDRGDTWKCIGTLKTYYDLDESSIAQLRDGRLVMVARPEGALSWSSDGGHTWADPVRLPFRMFDPWLLTLKDGTLLCVHGSYHKEKRGLRAILSQDGGKTWLAAGPDYGFSIDPSAYGYSRGVQLPDGSVFIAYQQGGGHTFADACRMQIFGMRFRVFRGGRGIELLPAAASPAKQK